jgi:hypothetical protein
MAALTMCSEHKEFTGLKEDLKALGLQGNLFIHLQLSQLLKGTTEN